VAAQTQSTESQTAQNGIAGGSTNPDHLLSESNRMTDEVDSMIGNSPALQQVGDQVRSTLHTAILSGGTPTRLIADLLHGTWLGHPLHPVLIEITVGSFALSTLFDVFSLFNRSRSVKDTADALAKVGVISAVPTALTGMTDYSGIKQDAVAHGTLHAMTNTIGLAAYLVSLRAKSQRARGTGILFSLLGMGVLTFSAWLGGELVYRLRVGVNHTTRPEAPKTWMPVLPAAQLVEGQPKRIDVEGTPVLLVRRGSEVYAIGAVCSHAGGPLDEGKFEGVCVQCPWHDSVFDLRDGSVVHGPATYRQPTYEARTVNGQIELRAVNAHQSTLEG
jgi:nitrite reductase/ring-hydroxylating ferredoxin subunit/uncharacterized membrane protein